MENHRADFSQREEQELEVNSRYAPTDRATEWARAVIDGDIVAGPHVRNAARRHLHDLENAEALGIEWDVGAAEYASDFFEEVLHLTGGQYMSIPFELFGWEAFVVGSLFGWKNKSTGLRRFREAYVETAKGSGKSPLAAGIGLYGLVADGEFGAQVYAAATKREQAQVLFRAAVSMVRRSPHLLHRLVQSGTYENTWNLSYPATESFFRVIASDKKQSGPMPHVALVDELHEHIDNSVLEMLLAGFKSRRQPLMFVITNTGLDESGVYDDYHEYSIGVASQEIDNLSYFAFVCSLDEGDDPLSDESCWPKANPSLQEADIPGLVYLRNEVKKCEGLGSKRSLVLRLNFCTRTEHESTFIDKKLWLSSGRDYTESDLYGRKAFAAIDLASTTDLVGFALAVEPVQKGEPWKLLAYSWTMAKGLEAKEKKDKAPYADWVRDGWLYVTDGNAISKASVLKHIAKIASKFKILKLAYDRWRIEDLKSMANDLEIKLPEMEDFGQGYKSMSPAIDKFEEMILNGELVHNNNPMLTRCMSNLIIVSDDAGCRKPSKKKSTGRIDPCQAAIMTCGLIARREKKLSLEERLNNVYSIGV